MTFYQHIEALREALGGRRFLLSAGAGIVNTLLVVHGFITPTIFESLTIATVGMYIAGNGWQRLVEKKSAQQPNG